MSSGPAARSACYRLYGLVQTRSQRDELFLFVNHVGRRKKQKAHSLEWAFKTPAASYSPTGLPLQYHRP